MLRNQPKHYNTSSPPPYPTLVFMSEALTHFTTAGSDVRIRLRLNLGYFSDVRKFPVSEPHCEPRYCSPISESLKKKLVSGFDFVIRGLVLGPNHVFFRTSECPNHKMFDIVPYMSRFACSDGPNQRPNVRTAKSVKPSERPVKLNGCTCCLTFTPSPRNYPEPLATQNFISALQHNKLQHTTTKNNNSHKKNLHPANLF